MGMNTSISSGALTSGTLLFSGKTYLKGVYVDAGATLQAYDATTASGKLVLEVVNTDGTTPVFCDFSHMVQCQNGLYANVSGGTVFVYYG